MHCPRRRPSNRPSLSRLSLSGLSRLVCLACLLAPRAEATPLQAVPQSPVAETQQAAPPKRQPPKAGQDKIEWLTDAEGRPYRLEPIPKNQAVKIAPDKVRTIWGVPADLVREDDQFFYIKLYKVGPPPPPTRVPGSATPQAAARPEVLPRASARLRWTPYGTGLPTRGQWRDGLVLVDLTGDGRLDIVTSPPRKTLRPPAVFVHEGATWKASAAFRYPPRPFDYGDIAVGDLNRDGALDLVLGVHLRGLMALRGSTTEKGGGQFEDASTGLPFSTDAAAPVFSSRALKLSDCNGDGLLDILALGEGPRPMGAGARSVAAVSSGIGSFVQQADGTWKPSPQSRTAGLFGASIAAGDVDGDGTIDLVTAPGTLGDTRLLHRGDGACGWQAETVEAARPRSYVTAVATGDVNGDGAADVIAGYMDFVGDGPVHGVDVLMRGKDGHWTRRALARASGRIRIEAVATGDLDGDGKLDVAALGAEGALTVFLGDGRGGFTRERQTLPSPGTCAGSSIAIGDLDGDGLSDLVISYAQESSPSSPGLCPGEGALSAWKTGRQTGAARSSTPAPPRKPAAAPALPRKP